MSAFNAWLSNEKFIIASDTLCSLSTSYGNVVKNFLTKVYHLPQYKCCYTSQGLRDFGLEFFVFIQQEVKAYNLYSLLESIKSFRCCGFVIRDDNTTNHPIKTTKTSKGLSKSA